MLKIFHSFVAVLYTTNLLALLYHLAWLIGVPAPMQYSLLFYISYSVLRMKSALISVDQPLEELQKSTYLNAKAIHVWEIDTTTPASIRQYRSTVINIAVLFGTSFIHLALFALAALLRATASYV